MDAPEPAVLTSDPLESGSLKRLKAAFARGELSQEQFEYSLENVLEGEREADEEASR